VLFIFTCYYAIISERIQVSIELSGIDEYRFLGDNIVIIVHIGLLRYRFSLQLNNVDTTNTWNDNNKLIHIAP